MSGDPPGPQGDRFTGNLHAFTTDPLGFLTGCARRYGDVVSIGARNVLFCDPGDVERVLVDRDRAFAKSTVDSRKRTHKPGFPDAMMNSNGADWRRKRDRLTPAFGRKLLATTVDLARQEAGRLADQWPTDQTLDPAPAVARLTLRTVTKLMFGDAMPDADIAVVSRLAREIMNVSVSPIALPEWIPSPQSIRMRRALRDIDRVVARIVARNAPDAPVLDTLLTGSPSPGELRDELATLVLSGFETTKNAVLWCCDLLARHPEAADRVADEAAIASRAGAAGAALLDTLPFTNAVVREALRLYPPAWITSREALRELEFQGYRIPAGTTVTVSQWVTHRDRRWHEHPLDFQPERWLRSARQPPRGAYFPFGLGSRACIGAAIATTETAMVIMELSRRFRMRLVEATAVRPRPALSLQPSGFRLQLQARQRAGAG
jgi:cytochrome P450